MEALRYERGRLELIDQRKLPQEETWIPVNSAADAWDCINKMVVRGAPAIAITGALALALEVENGAYNDCTTGEEVSQRVSERAEYIKTSRPTAVNIFNAADDVKNAAKDAAASGKGPREVMEEVVAKAELLKHNDDETNRAMGMAGASAIQHATGKNKVTVLTHCNTGALATASFGTAFGVIRTLWEGGNLERAYCTETRPYSQGSRLTATEFVRSGIPATLIADSAASSLISLGKVDAVVVGADRITVNGDTANKIGTYMLALAAKEHGVPFFVAAPTGTIDVNSASGREVKVEERNRNELTQLNGVQLAPDEVDVFNPAFDVTPAQYITAIVTEKGAITRKGQEETLDAASHCGTSKIPSFEGAFVALNESLAKDYAASKREISSILGGDKHQWSCTEVGDGNINFVYILKGPGGSVAIKQGLPYVRIVGEGMPISQERCEYEAKALQKCHELCPEHTPQVFLFDKPMCAIAMQFLPPPHAILRGELVKGRQFPNLAAHMGRYLARTLFFTSDWATTGSDYRSSVHQFGPNTPMCGLTEDVVFTDPYFPAPLNKHTSPQLDDRAAELYKDKQLKAAASEMKHKFITHKQALIHGDLHTGSLMVTDENTFCMDHEFAFHGPIGFDVGAFLGNLLIAYIASYGHERWGGESREGQREWLLSCIKGTWEHFVSIFAKLWAESVEHGSSGPSRTEVFSTSAASGRESFAELQKNVFTSYWRDTLGFAGCKMTRRVVGVAHVADLEKIPDADVRAECEKRVLDLGRSLIIDGHRDGTIQSAHDLIALAQRS